MSELHGFSLQISKKIPIDTSFADGEAFVVQISVTGFDQRDRGLAATRPHGFHTGAYAR